MSASLEGLMRLAREGDFPTRLMIGRNATTPAEVLFALAKDAEAEIRASVAANPRAPFSVLHLLVADESPVVREALANRIAILVPGLTGSTHDRLTSLVEPILLRLVEDTVLAVRSIIANAVKTLPNICRPAVLRLAMDVELQVAEPVIRHSPILTEDDLLNLIAAPPSPITVLAIARRPGISAAISAALIADGDAAAVAALLDNATAELRDLSQAALILRSRERHEWLAKLVQRPDLSAESILKLVQVVIEVMLQPLLQRDGLKDQAMFSIKQSIADRIGLPMPSPPRGLAAKGIDPLTRGFPAKSMVWPSDLAVRQR